jgi:hypothetical protein
MKSVSRLAMFALLASASSPAMGAPATPEEAQRLTALIESYLGKTPGVTAVTVNGEGYDLVIDPAPLLKTLEANGDSTSITPLRYNLKDQGGGKWLVTQDQKLELDVAIAPVLQLKVQAAGYKSSGIFSESLGAFETSHTTVTDMSIVEDVAPPDQAKTHLDYAIKSMEFAMSAALSPEGGLDGTGTLNGAGLAEDIMMPTPGGTAAPIHVSVTSEKIAETFNFNGLKLHELWPVINWLREHPSDSAIKDGHAELAGLLRKALPLFGSLSMDADVKTLEVGTILGAFGVKTAHVGIVMNGAVSDGLFGESIAVEGLKMPPGVVPPFATDLAPSSASVSFKISDFDLAAPAKLLLDHLEKTSDDPSAEMQKRLQDALMPKGKVKITLDPGSFVSTALTVDYQGSIHAGLGTDYFGEALVKAKGLDEMIKILQSAPAEMGLAQGIYGILAAKGFGKTEADGAITWRLETNREGMVSVNGVALPGQD